MAQATRATLDGPLVPSFGVKLDGRPLTSEIGQWIVNVVVDDSLGKPSMFMLELSSMVDEERTIPWHDDQRFEMGTKVEVSMGYRDDRESLIVGEITALEPNFSDAHAPTLAVYGYDRRHRLNTVRRTQGFVNQKDSDIAKMICEAANVGITSTASGVTHPYVLQADQTDLAFLQDRADRMHYEVAMVGEIVHFRPVASAPRREVELAWNNDLLEFRPRMSMVPLTTLRVLGWDPKTKETFTGFAPDGDFPVNDNRRLAAQQAETVLGKKMTVETLVREPAASQPEADQMAKARFNAAALDFIRGEGRVRGRTDVRAGSVVSLTGLGKRFDGVYYVDSAIHRYSGEGYVTDFQVRGMAS